MKRALLLGAIFAFSTLAGGCAKVGEVDPVTDLLFRGPRSDWAGIDPAAQRLIVGCGPEVDAEIEARISRAYSVCQDAWNSRPEHDHGDWGHKAGQRMMELKLLFEAHYSDCRQGDIPDFWEYFQVWRPGHIWSREWDPCFGAHPAYEPTCMQ